MADRFAVEVANVVLARLWPLLESRRSEGAGKSLPRLMTVKQASEYLARSQSAIEKLIFRKEIPVVRHGRSVRLDRLELDQWIQEDSK
jgi:excisionase family DNA binding protein